MRMDYSAGTPLLRNDKREDPLNTTDSLESSPVRDEGKAISKIDNRFNTSPGIACSSPCWRSSRKNKLDQENKKKRLPTKCRKAGSKIPLLDVSSFQFTRGRRSSLCKKARATVWGLLGNVAAILGQNCSIDVSPQKPNTSGRLKGIESHGKRETKKKVRNSSKLKGKRFTATGPISLKIKFGSKETVRLMNVRATTDYNKEECSKTEKYFPEGSMSFQSGDENSGKASDVHLVIEDITENADGNSDFCESPFRGEFDNVVVTVDNQILDSGSSPDSEVINLTPDAQICEKDPEAFHLALNSTETYLAESPNLILLCKDAYRGKREIDDHQTTDFGVNVEVPCPENIVDVPKFSKLSQKEQVGELLYHSDDSTLTTEIASVNALEVEKFPKQPLCSEVTDLAIASDLSKVESGVGASVSSRLSLELGSVESDIWKNPCTHGQKLAKSSRPRRATKSSLKTTESSRREKTSEKEGSQEKSSGKQKGKDKGLKDDFTLNLHEVENHHETETGGTGSGNKSLTRDTSQNTMVPVAMVQQCIPLRQAWVCCDDCEKWRRIPAAFADQVAKNDRWVCKDNKDKDFADCSIPQEMSNEDINAELDLSDPCCEEYACDVLLDSVQLIQKQQKVTGPPSWMRIKSNLLLHRRRKTQAIDEVMVCHCKPPSEGRVGCGDGCLNRMLNIECMQGTCPCGEFCSNQQFQKRKYAKLKSIKCGRKGFGLHLLEDVSEGQFLIEYVGEVLDMHAYESRQRDYAVKGHKHFYFMTLNGSEVIDACAKGNLGRFINHSCDPNCRTEKWIVNGEVCIGIFALRDIKKGEEVTFDYNYIRVFGAAAKKCVCGSSLCRGYIGGDPLKADIIVEDDSDDEYPDPVAVHGNGEMNQNPNNAIARAIKEPSEVKDHINGFVSVNRNIGMSSENLTTEMSNHAKINIDCTTSAGCLEITKESGDLRRSASTALSVTISEEKECSVGQHFPVQIVGTSLQSGDITSESMSSASEEYSATEKSTNNPSCTNQGSDASFQYAMSDKIDSKMKVNFNVGQVRVVLSKSHAQKKSSAVEKRPKTDSLDTKKPLEIDVKVHLPPSEPKRLLEDLSNGRFEAVQEKLNELLDNDGGISKRKDASRGYLKLLLLTAASEDSDNGEKIESNRDLSMILDALLKTKSRTVLVDIINKNGLQMLHNIMKRCRKEFIKIPILRKLLKVLEYLATRDILTSEHINGGPRCPGVESFSNSILSLTEHSDKQVHHIARSFRDRWIPRSFRKFGCIDRDDCRTEFRRDSTHDIISASHANSSDCATIHSQKLDGIANPVLALNCADAQMPDVSIGSRGTCKRKSRWDQPTKGSPNLGADTSMAGDGANMYEDVPPGFSAPLNHPMVPSDAYVSDVDHKKARSSQAKCPYGVALGHPQPIFISRSPITYGMPVSFVRKFGTYQAETSENWIVAPGMPFQPFPPLPPYPRDKSKHSTMSQAGQKADPESLSRSTNSSQNLPSTPEATGVGMETINQPNFRGVRGPQNLPRKYYRQEKWNRSVAGTLQIQKKNGLESMGNNSSNGMSQTNSRGNHNVFGRFYS